MKSSVHPKYKTKYRVGNWPEYERALVHRGGQRKFSDHAIETAPDHTTLSRRSQHLDVRFHLVPADDPLHLIVDSTGLSIVGEGEWAAVKHGGRGTRGWKKLHLGVDR